MCEFGEAEVVTGKMTNVWIFPKILNLRKIKEEYPQAFLCQQDKYKNIQNAQELTKGKEDLLGLLQHITSKKGKCESDCLQDGNHLQ